MPNYQVFFGPKAVKLGDRTFVFVATGDNLRLWSLTIKYATWDGQKWSDFTALPNPNEELGVGTGFSLLPTPDNKLQLVATLGGGYGVARITFDGSKWSDWDRIPSDDDDHFFRGIPYVVSAGKSSYDYYALHDNGSISYKFWDGAKYNPAGRSWLFIDAPKGTQDDEILQLHLSVTPDYSTKHLWALLTNDSLIHTTVSGSKVGKWEDLRTGAWDLPTVLHRDNRIITLAASSNVANKPSIRSFDGTKWSEWETISDGTYFGATYGSFALGFIPPNHLSVLNTGLAPHTNPPRGFITSSKFNGTWFPAVDQKMDLVQFYNTTGKPKGTVSTFKRPAGRLEKLAAPAGQQPLKDSL